MCQFCIDMRNIETRLAIARSRLEELLTIQNPTNGISVQITECLEECDSLSVQKQALIDRHAAARANSPESANTTQTAPTNGSSFSLPLNFGALFGVNMVQHQNSGDTLTYMPHRFHNVVVSLSDKYINALEKRNYSGDASGMFNTNCSICMTDFDTEDELYILPCKHSYHCGCINKWFETNVKCPICKSDIRDAFPEIKDIQHTESSANNPAPRPVTSIEDFFSQLAGLSNANDANTDDEEINTTDDTTEDITDDTDNSTNSTDNSDSVASPSIDVADYINSLTQFISNINTSQQIINTIPQNIMESIRSNYGNVTDDQITATIGANGLPILSFADPTNAEFRYSIEIDIPGTFLNENS